GGAGPILPGMRDPRATAPRPDPAPPPAPDAVAALGTILSVWAHPDDETYLAAGVMAAARDHGQRVVCATATAGERGTDDPDTWPPDRLGRVRRWEAAAAMAVLGVREHLVLGLPDGDLAAHEEEGLDWAGRLVDAVAPDTILTFGPDGMTFHPRSGERGTDDPDTWPPDRLGRVRRWEAAAAMAVLGVREHLVLGLPDGDLAAHEEEGLDWAGRLVDAVAPDTILTFGPDGMTFHP